MILPEHLKKKRDELRPSDLHFRKECGDYPCGAHKSWNEGFNTAFEELLPMIEKLEKALSGVSDRHNWMPGLGECVCQNHKYARQALAELKKWRES